jgi:glycine/D-amino acid oxidase-like deaminating enzyme
VVQRLDGSLTIGDTHDYDEPFAFDLDEESYRHLLARATSLLRRPLPPVRRRWAGVYSEVRDASRELYWREEIDDGIEVVSGAGGRGMTCSPAIAEQSVAHLAG